MILNKEVPDLGGAKIKMARLFFSVTSFFSDA